MEDVCNCECHRSPSVRHFMPCCQTCPTCRQRIVNHNYQAHIQKCRWIHFETNLTRSSDSIFVLACLFIIKLFLNSEIKTEVFVCHNYWKQNHIRSNRLSRRQIVRSWACQAMAYITSTIFYLFRKQWSKEIRFS